MSNTDPLTPQVETFLAHYGIKGMRWGVRNDESHQARMAKGKAAAERLQIKDRTESLSVRMKNGDVLELSGDPTPAVSKLLSRMSRKYGEGVNRYSSFTVKNKDGETVGSLSMNRDTPKTLNIVWVDTKDAHKGRGYATATMSAAIQHARREGVEKITLEVPGRSPDARHIYEKLGFKDAHVVTTPEDDEYWGGLMGMELDLK